MNLFALLFYLYAQKLIQILILNFSFCKVDVQKYIYVILYVNKGHRQTKKTFLD